MVAKNMVQAGKTDGRISHISKGLECSTIGGFAVNAHRMGGAQTKQGFDLLDLDNAVELLREEPRRKARSRANVQQGASSGPEQKLYREELHEPGCWRMRERPGESGGLVPGFEALIAQRALAR